MEGIQFVINDKGEKIGVIIDLVRHGKIWEKFYDDLIAKTRKNEPKDSLESVKEGLEQHKSTSITEQLCGRRGESKIEDYDFHIELERFGGDINAGK